MVSSMKKKWNFTPFLTSKVDLDIIFHPSPLGIISTYAFDGIQEWKLITNNNSHFSSFITDTYNRLKWEISWNTTYFTHFEADYKRNKSCPREFFYTKSDDSREIQWGSKVSYLNNISSISFLLRFKKIVVVAYRLYDSN